MHLTRTRLTYNNDKPWFTAKLRQLRQAKEDACRRGLKSCINRPNTHWKRRSAWQRGIILASWGTNSLPVILLQCGKVWETLPITRHHPPALWRINNWRMIRMIFTVGWRKKNHPPWTPLHTTINTSSNSPLPHTCTENKQRWQLFHCRAVRASALNGPGGANSLGPVAPRPKSARSSTVLH